MICGWKVGYNAVETILATRSQGHSHIAIIAVGGNCRIVLHSWITFYFTNGHDRKNQLVEEEEVFFYQPLSAHAKLDQ